MTGATVATDVVPQELRDRLEGLASYNAVVKFTIADEHVTETGHVSTGGSLGYRYQKAAELAGDVSDEGRACFLMIFVEQRKWVLVTYVPDNAPAREKMLYSSSQAALVEAWPQEVVELHHANLSSDITDLEARNSKPAPKPLSEREMVLNEAKQMETKARSEHLEVVSGMRQKVRRGASGGYHVVDMPITQNAKDEMESFHGKALNWIRFRISDDAEEIDAVESATSVPTGRLAVATTEPGFYLVRLGGDVCFLYVCPSESQLKLRMVYSTSKPAMRDHITKQGITIQKTLEYFSAEDVTSTAVRQEMSCRTVNYSSSQSAEKSLNAQGTLFGVTLQPVSRSVSDSAIGSGRKSPSEPSTVNASHPVYQMGIKSSLTGFRKGIVIPPPGAYN